MVVTEKDSTFSRPAGGPVWYVTNGEAVVGPVDTELLLRGITSARIPNDCMVIQPNWGAWRALDQIREYRRLGRSFCWESEGDLSPGIPEEFVRLARDAGEALFFAMQAAVKATRATAGLVHRRREPFVGLVTSSVLGPGVDEQLGQVVPRSDAVLERALTGEILLGRLDGAKDEAERAMGRRFSSARPNLLGVAMVPVFDGGRLLAMIELAREGHPFRAEDRAVLRKIGDVVSLR